MKTKLQVHFTVLILVSMLVGMMSTSGYAEDTKPTSPNLWYGERVSCDVTAGQNGYTFQSVYPSRAYEMSNHMVSAGAIDSIPQTLVMIDASREYIWKPDSIYTFGKSNYEVLYCCDADTGYEDKIYYKRMNLEDSTYYDLEEAAHIRAIITNSYPFVSLEQMKANLAAEGFAEADRLTRAEVITAVQTAVWAYSNDASSLKYSHTFHVPDNPQWGTVFHDYTNEMNVWWDAGKYIKSFDERVGARINALAEHLKANEKLYAEAQQVVITELKILDTIPVQEKEGVYNVLVQAVLNNGGSSVQDNVYIRISVEGTEVGSVKAELGKNVYNMTVPVEAGQTVEAVVSGTQILPEGVYFYQPEGGNEVSQSLVGVAAGATEVYTKATVKPDLPQENQITADLKLQKIGVSGENLSGAVFELSAVKNNTAYSIGSYTVDINGQLTIENLLPGIYQIKETIAPAGHQLPDRAVGIIISDQGEIRLSEDTGSEAVMKQGVLSIRNVQVPPPYVPPYIAPTVSVSAEKVWAGDNAEFRPESIAVQLLRNGAPAGTITLSENKGWKHTWFGLSDVYTWTVAEANVPEGYTSEVAQNGMIFTITNTYEEEVPEEKPYPPISEEPVEPEATEKPEVPQEDAGIDEPEVPLTNIPETSDSANMMLWMILTLLSAAILFGIRITEKKER